MTTTAPLVVVISCSGLVFRVVHRLCLIHLHHLHVHSSICQSSVQMTQAYMHMHVNLASSAAACEGPMVICYMLYLHHLRRSGGLLGRLVVTDAHQPREAD